MKPRPWSYDNEAFTRKQRQRSYVNQAMRMQEGSGHTPAMLAMDKDMIKKWHRKTPRSDTQAHGRKTHSIRHG
eukprot:422386-Lingulodinium_polyedra.AAC.1